MKWKINWRKYFKHLPTDWNLDIFDDLMKLSIKSVMDTLEKANRKQEVIFGYLLLMCKSFPCQLGALCAQSFVVHMILSGNLLVTDKRTLMDDKLINKLIVLRMNKIFMEYTRKNVKTTLCHMKGIGETTL